jgi:trehalose 6-phosphate phosphatase
MKYLLSAGPRGHRALVEQFAWSNVLLAFDFDGTLAPIVEDRDAARMRPETAALFREVCRRYPVAVLSGRGRDDVASRLEGASVRWVVGNHGMEPIAEEKMAAFCRVVAEKRPLLEARLGALRGLDIEDKTFSLAVHYRHCRRKGDARDTVAAAVRELWPTARVVGGKQVVNLLPQGAPHKGLALEGLIVEAKTDTAVYLGDDITDEDVFERDEPGRLLSIRVGRSTKSAAPYFLRHQDEMDKLLSLFVASRREDGSGGRQET